MHRPLDSSFTFPDLLWTIKRHRSMAVLWCICVLVVALAAIVLLPRGYQSDAKLFVRLGREVASLDPTATTGTVVQVQENRENQLNSTRDMLKSRGVLERVVNKVGPERILSGGPPTTEPDAPPRGRSTLSSAMRALGLSFGVSDSEKAIAKLNDSIGVTIARNSSVIDLYCMASSPDLAQEILGVFIEAYREQYLAANTTDGSVEFFAAQAAQLKHQLDRALDELREEKNKAGLVSILGEQQDLQAQFGKVEEASLVNEAQLAATQASIKELNKLILALPEKTLMEQTSGIANAAADSMQQELFRVETTVRELQAKLGKDHPLVKVQLSRVKELQGILDAEAPERAQTKTGINTARQSLELDVRRDLAMVASLRAKDERLKQQMVALHDRMRSLNDQELRIAELTRESTLAEENYKRYATHLEQARIVESLEAHRISSVNVVQAPSLVEKPVTPKRALILGLAFMAALSGVIGVPVACERFGYLFHKTRVLESQPGLVVLGTPPHVRPEPAPLNC